MKRIPNWFSWGLADQAISSSTNFGLTLLAGRILGPSGLGIVFLGFAMYLLSLAVHRALIFDPLVVTSAPLDEEARRAKTTAALAITISTASFVAALTLVIGLTIASPLARGMLLFAPWIVPAMLQDFWRAVLFRDGRGRSAAMNDLIWLGGMAVALPLITQMSDKDWMVVAAWGSGSLLAAAAGFLQTRIRPGATISTLRSWTAEAWPLGRWLAAGSVIYIASVQLVVFLLGSILGPAAIGGFRAVQTLFAPMTLLGPGAALPGLPRLARTVNVSLPQARRLAAKISGVITVLAFVYVVALLVGGSVVIATFFGDAFSGYDRLIIPMSLGQLVLAAALGFSLLLKASQRGDSLFITRLIAAVAALGLVPLLAVKYGLIGGVWGFVAASTLENCTLVALAFTSRFGRPKGGSIKTPSLHETSLE